MQIGFVGLGPMGAAMARRLLASGHAVTVWNRTAEKMQKLVEAGAKPAASPASAAHGADLVLSSVANDTALGQVTHGPDGIASGLAPGGIHVSLSTVSVALIDRLAEAHQAAGQILLSAPVLGRPPAAESGSLFVMAGGPASAIARAKPALEAFSQRIFGLGERPSQANLAKLACNFLIFSTIEQFGEVFALAEKSGLDRGALFTLLTESFFTAPVHKNYGKLILEKSYAPGVPVSLGAKDTRLLLEAGEDLAVPLPLASLLRDRFLAARAHGDDAKDFTIIAQLAAEAAGLN